MNKQSESPNYRFVLLPWWKSLPNSVKYELMEAYGSLEEYSPKTINEEQLNRIYQQHLEDKAAINSICEIH